MARTSDEGVLGKRSAWGRCTSWLWQHAWRWSAQHTSNRSIQQHIPSQQAWGVAWGQDARSGRRYEAYTQGMGTVGASIALLLYFRLVL